MRPTPSSPDPAQPPPSPDEPAGSAARCGLLTRAEAFAVAFPGVDTAAAVARLEQDHGLARPAREVFYQAAEVFAFADRLAAAGAGR